MQNPQENIPSKDLSERATLLEQALSGQGELLAELRRKHALLISTFNAIGDAILVTDAAGRVTEANEAVRFLFNLVPEEVIGTICHSLLAEGQTCPHLRSIGQTETVECELLNRRQDRALNLRIAAIPEPDQQGTRYIHVIRDVTRERVLERHLMQAERMSLAGQMVSAVAHEVATPLSVVANIAEMLQLDVDSGSRAANELGKIVAQVRRVTELMRGLLNFVRQEQPRYSPVDLGRLAQETLDLMNYELRKARIETTLIVSPQTPPVWGNSAQLQQVLLNLLTNAMQAIKEGGRIAIRVGRDNRSGKLKAVALTVEDTGSGVPPEAMGRIFEFFYTTRIGEGGTGLGLAITRQIVEGHNGQITAENVSGGGARFLITLPAAFPQH